MLIFLKTDLYISVTEFIASEYPGGWNTSVQRHPDCEY